MKIERHILLEKLLEFVQADHGVVIGNPGIGKTYILRELKNALLKNNTLAFIIEIENIPQGSDSEIQRELGINENWIDTLNQITNSNEKAILIFDAFDAARDEQLRSKVLLQIARAKSELSNKWNIIVSVRTYDAIKSPALIKLFPLGKGKSEVSCRSYAIPKLSDEELQSLLEADSNFQAIYSDCTAELRDILHTPYFITLLREVLILDHSDEVKSKIKSFKSETQLLERFWRTKIVSHLKSTEIEKLLFGITERMMSAKTTTISKSTLFEVLHDSAIPSYDLLRSENILDEYSITNSRIGYSHNILFDYAVCRMFLSDDYQSLLTFIQADQARPFYLRPSFIYFFSHLWYDARETFWTLYLKLLDVNDDVIQLSLRLILNTIIASAYESNADVSKLLAINDRDKKGATVRQLFQSIAFLRQNKPEPRDIKIILELSDKLQLDFIWELSFILQKAVELKSFDTEIQHDLGISIRNFFSFVLRNRDNPIIRNKEGFDRLGASRGVKLVCLTYSTNITESRNLLEKVLNLLSESNFEIWYLSVLCDGIESIIACDAKFAAKIYSIIFNHHETSDEKTNMGGGVALNLVSNRRQDFDMCHHRLIEHFPKFLQSSPLIAIEIGLQVVSNHILENRFDSLSTPKKFLIEIDGNEYKFISDLSYWDHDYEYHDSPTKMLTEITGCLENLITAGEHAAFDDCLKAFYKNAQAALSWKELIDLGNRFPKELKVKLFPLTTSRVILESRETVYQITDFIRNIFSYCSQSERLKIETNVLSILDNVIEGLTTDPDHKKDRVSRILNVLPKELLQLKSSQIFLEQHQKVVPNQPLVKSTFSIEPVTPESWLEDHGIDINQPTNANTLTKLKDLRAFNVKWLNASPSRVDYLQTLENANRLFLLLASETESVDKEIYDDGLTELAKTYAIICRSISTLTESELSEVQDNLVFCYNFESEYDREKDNNSSPSSGYSATPKIEAAEAFPALVSVDYSNTMIVLYQKVVNDQNAIVRFNSIKYLFNIKKRYPKEYWEILYSRLQNERDSFTASILLNYFDTSIESQPFINRALEIANTRKDLQFDRSSFTEQFVHWALLLTVNNNLTAKGIIANNIGTPTIAKQLVYKIFDAIDPGSPHNDYTKDNSKRATIFEILHEIIDNYGKPLRRVTDASKFDQDVKDSIELLDTIVQQIFFSLGLRGARRRDRLPVSEENRIAYYRRIKPSLRLILNVAQSTTASGMLIPHTAYYFSQILNGVVSYDPKEVLSMTLEITKYSYSSGYTFDSSSIEQIISLTEKIFADHRSLLFEKESFDKLIELLDLYVKSGWTSALELLWKLDDIFR